jgi:PAS domain S-box-containing protein
MLVTAEGFKRQVGGWSGMAEEQQRVLFGAMSNGLMDLLRTTHDCLIARDGEGCVMLWNRAAEQLYGWPAPEARGHLLAALLKTQFPRPLRDIESELYATGRWEGELVHTTRAGRPVVVASRWSVQADEQGQCCAVLQVERDLTEERQTQEELRQVRAELEQCAEQRLNELAAANEALVESQARFRQVAEAIQDVFWLTNPSRSSIIYVNPAYAALWGRACESLYVDPHSWLEAVHAEDRPRLRQFFANRVAAEGYEHSYRIVRPDCSIRWVLDRGFPVRESAGGSSRVVGIVRDVTKRKELEEGILAISEREQHRLGEDLHDDLCQQLAGIELLSKALEQQAQGPPLAAKAGEIAQLLRAAMAYTRHLARGLAPLELQTQGLLHSLQALAGRTSELFKVECTFECPEMVVVQDPIVRTHLYRIAQEAVTNGRKHGKATRIRMLLAATPAGGELTIEDNGLGLSEQAQLAPGMGLRIMRYRADIIGGSFALESHPGATMIRCAFPLTSW